MRTSKKKIGRYLNREDFGLSGFAWAVAEDYGKNTDEKVVATKVGDIRFYAPLEDSNLFFSFAKLASRGSPSDNSVLRWVKKYGLLKAKQEGAPLCLSNDGLNQAPMPIEELKFEARRARSALNLHYHLCKRDIWSARRSAGELREYREQWSRNFETRDRLKVGARPVEGWGDEDEGGTLTDELPRWVAEMELAALVTSKVKNVRPDLTGGGFWDEFDDGYRPMQSWRCPDLISAIYLQFYLLITDSLPLRRCKNPACRMPFPVTRTNRMTCDSSCRSNKRHYPDSD